MRIAILANLAAGRGKGRAFATSLESALSQAGHQASLITTTSTADEKAAAIERAEAVVIAGGDGTLHHALPLLLASPRPIFHAALGTENLFAREFGHRANVAPIVGALERIATREVDLATMDEVGTTFAIMASIGPDAGVIHRLARRRAGPITHASYTRPILDELLQPSLPRLTIDADGTRIVSGVRGMAVFSNLRQYALRLNPSPDADSADGLLDLAFFPASCSLAIPARLIASRLGLGPAIRARAREFRVTSDESTGPIQADGEAIHSPSSGPSPTSLTLRIRPKSLRVFSI